MAVNKITMLFFYFCALIFVISQNTVEFLSGKKDVPFYSQKGYCCLLINCIWEKNICLRKTTSS